MEEEGARARPKLALGGEVDLISTLPDDLLLRILYLVPCTRGLCAARGCARAAWINTTLSSRWRLLLIQLADLTYHDSRPESVLASIHRRLGIAPAPRRSTRACVLQPRSPSPTIAVAKVDPPPALAVVVPHLDISVLSPYDDSPLSRGSRHFPLSVSTCMQVVEVVNTSSREEVVRSLLDAAAMLAPSDLRFAVGRPGRVQVNVPCFHHATSIELQGMELVFTDSLQSRLVFPSLERLSLSRCRATISNWLSRSPRLLVLRVSTVTNDDHDDLKFIIVRSKSLQELNVEAKLPSLTHNKASFVDNVNIDAPALKQLTMSFGTFRLNNLLVSVSAPMLEKVSWKCVYSGAAAGIGRWGLLRVGLKPVETNGEGQLPHVHALSLSADTQRSYMFSGAAEELRFKAEIKKHVLIPFSMLELHIMTSGHLYGAFASRILRMGQTFTLIKSLKIVLVSSKSKEPCPENCRCEEPKDWRTQSIYLPKLEEVEIRGEDHEFDFWKLVISRAPNLKRVVMDRPSNEVKMDSWRMKLITILGPGIAIADGCDGA